MDCSMSLGNNGCGGGSMSLAFDYIKANGGIDSEKDYPYKGQNGICWTKAANRTVASLASFTSVPPNEEAQLVAAVGKGPVSVAIEVSAGR